LPIHNESAPKATQERTVPLAQMDEEILKSLTVNESTFDKKNLIAEKPLVLIADDNADVCAYVASCLTTDYHLNIAKDGQECEDIAFETTPDVIVLDVMMPYKNGFDVCKTLKNDERTSHIPIIMLTAKADMDSKLQGLEQGADAYLMKPFNKEELLIRIKKLLDLRLQLQIYYHSTMSINAFENNKEGLEKGSDILVAKKELPNINSFDNSFALKVKTVIEAHLTDTNFGVEQLARALALSPSQVNRKLLALTGLSTGHFIRTLRLAKSKELLQHSGYSISAIAYDSGFSDPAYFSRIFKQTFGTSPQQWREENPT
jgi:YesN/AraC family two-component response regulator